MVTIRNERTADVPAREALLDLAYGPARFTKPSQKLREGRLAGRGLSLRGNRGRPHRSARVRLWHVDAGTARPALLLGPLAVHPDCAQSRHRRGTDAACNPLAPECAGMRPCCWSAMRRTTAASDSRRQKPAICECRASMTATGCWRSNLCPGRSMARRAGSSRPASALTNPRLWPPFPAAAGCACRAPHNAPVYEYVRCRAAPGIGVDVCRAAP